MQLPSREEIERVRMGMEFQRMSAILTAVLLKHGRVTLSRKESEAVYKEPQLHSEVNPVTGETSFWVTHKGLTPREESQVLDAERSSESGEGGE